MANNIQSEAEFRAIHCGMAQCGDDGCTARLPPNESLFADDGIIELPTVNARAQGPVAIQSFVTGLLAKVPDFRFENVRIWIETPDRVFGEYDAQGHVLSTGKLYKQTYAGVLVAEHGKIKLLHEALDTLAASRAFSADGV